MEKLDAITIPADALARLSDRVDEESLADFARDLAKSRINLVRIWYKEVTPENVLRFLSFYFERNKTARIALSKDERPQHVIGFHRGGMKGSNSSSGTTPSIQVILSQESVSANPIGYNSKHRKLGYMGNGWPTNSASISPLT